jgi:hypothetical protein
LGNLVAKPFNRLLFDHPMAVEGQPAQKTAVFFNYKGFSAVLGRHPTIGQVSSTIGQVSSTIGQVSSTIGQVSSTVGQVSSTVGQVSSTVREVLAMIGERAGMVARSCVRLFRRARKTGQLRSYPVACKLFILSLQKKNAPSFGNRRVREK